MASVGMRTKLRNARRAKRQADLNIVRLVESRDLARREVVRLRATLNDLIEVLPHDLAVMWAGLLNGYDEDRHVALDDAYDAARLHLADFDDPLPPGAKSPYRQASSARGDADG